jgi:hypothetical protein
MTKRILLALCALLLLAVPAQSANNRAEGVQLIITDRICSGGDADGEDCWDETATGACVVGGGTCGANARTVTTYSPWITSPPSARGAIVLVHALARTGDETARFDIDIPYVKEDTLTSFANSCFTVNAAPAGYGCVMYPSSLTGTDLNQDAMPIPRRWRVKMFHSGTGTATYYAELQWLY